MLPAPFEYHAPHTTEETLELLDQLGDEGKVLAGGQSLIPLLKLRFASPAHLVDVNRVPGLDVIEERDGVLRIGALFRHKAAERSTMLASRYPVIAEAAGQVADPIVRNRGTVGGSLAHADPAGDWGSVMLALDAEFVSPFLGPTSTTRLPPTGASAIRALAVTAATNVLAAGFMYLNPSPSYASVVRFTPAGQIDPRFARIIANNAARVAWSMALDSDGKVLIGGVGVFYNGGFGTPTVKTNWIAISRYNTNGTLDSTFHQYNTPPINFFSSEVRQLVVQPDGRVLFVAAIYRRGLNALAAPVLDRAIVGRVLADGSWDSSFAMITCALPLVQNPGPFWFDFPTTRPFARGEMPVPTTFVTRQPDGVVVLAGAFDSVNGEPRRRLARLEPGGELRGVLRLDIAPGAMPALTVPGEVETPYRIESSMDLETWTPWRTNTTPWLEWSGEVPVQGNRRFFRAVGP